ncbi:GNAT family N-acetyltransferase [Alkaliphilus serpentinus]|uniref:GNAT family N-acetyltransferase n=1 Tax=Alkaliphilus serpentinus TaxID=1482731 RepID=A0A833M8Z5_9FIRM|nr:GNAT family N-acetyltransferase [Alkaliphilus serpentinus]KAB3527686.1 GNAT family N-acetyltransferase [Alkaliphilus serpentinus]
MVELREITKETLRPILKLDVADNQKNLVAPNSVSIAQAYYEEKAWFRGIYDQDEAVGFVMLYKDEEKAEYFLWRFMIDKNHQGKGYGKEAMELIIDYVKGLPNAKTFGLSVVPADGSAEEFYKKFGFIDTGEVEENEKVYELTF